MAYNKAMVSGEQCSMNRSWCQSEVEAFLTSGMAGSDAEEDEEDDGLS